jgi:ATP-dependent helicase HrpA
VTSPWPALIDRLDGLTVRDRHRLARRIELARRQRSGTSEIERLTTAVVAAEARRAKRAATVPVVRYPPDLPVSERRDDIMAAIRDHQVVVVAGETGSGKTTQIPKMCLELGRGVDGMIGHTQPRRIAARTVAERLAEELDVPLGQAVGYAVRFTDRVGDTSLIKVMTDGILLAEIRRDRLLTSYDTIIVDEAHERSLNIDFLLGYLTQLLPKRPDLKVIITSATIDTARFAEHFSAPVVEVSGRTYPVEIRYRPMEADDGAGDDSDDDPDPNQALCRAVQELMDETSGDVLVFLPGERDIRDAADALRHGGPEGVEILPLYARLSAAEQHRAFRPHRGRRVVLATNVAETSLTVPGIRSVVDTGLARVSRYSHRTKVQRLPIERVSQASANQRSGRCGRVAPGVCIRLYSEEDFAARQEYTDPEILRTNLASVILQMADVGLGEIEEFPFIDPPDRRSVADGRALLDELGALEEQPGPRRITALGRRLAQLPVDPRLGRMVIEAERLDCLREVTVVAAALSIQDPREHPAEKAQAAAALHKRFAVADSDFLGFVRLWDYLAEIQSELSGNQFRRRCRAEFLNVLRIREWQDVAGQIRQVYRSQGGHANADPAPPAHVHQALLAGLLSHVGMRDKVRSDYMGARNSRWQIGRGSALARSQPAWVMAGALVETERTWARTVARIEPAWAERAGAHLVKRSYAEPWWDAKRGEAMTEERVTLYGLPVVAGRTVSLAPVDPEEARRTFIQMAMVERDWPVSVAALERTDTRIHNIHRLEDRVRRRDLWAGEEALFQWYQERLPAEVSNGRRFQRWWRRTSQTDPKFLDVPLANLLDRSAGPITLTDYPEAWVSGELTLPLRYRYEPGEPDDGVTVEVPLVVLNRLSAGGFDWHVPGYRPELIATLVRSLPKPLRRTLGPAPEVAEEILDRVKPGHGPLLDVVARQVARLAGQPVSLSVWDPERLPDHLRLCFEIVGDGGRVRARGRDLATLQSELRHEVQAAITALVPEFQGHGATCWDFGDLPRFVERGLVRGYPSLVDEGDAVGLALLDTAAAQAAAMWTGTQRLLRLTVPVPANHLQRRLSNDTKYAIAASDITLNALLDDCATAVIDHTMVAGGGPAFTQVGFEALAARIRTGFAEEVPRLATIAGGILATAASVREDVARLRRRDRGGVLTAALADVTSQMADLVRPGFVTAAGPDRLADLLRYTQAAGKRLERLPGDARRDRDRMASVAAVKGRYEELLQTVVDGTAAPTVRSGLAGVHWMIEELRVSLWAQQLGTPSPISVERIHRAIDALGDPAS